MQPCLYCPHHVVLLFTNMFLYYIWHPFIICFITSQIKSPKFVLCLFAIATWIFYVFYTLVYFFVRIYYLNMFNKLLIGFLDLKNICFDTNIIEIGTFLAILERKLYFMAAILNFQLFDGKNEETAWFLAVLNSALFRAQCYKFSCFYPDVHAQGTFCYISAPLLCVLAGIYKLISKTVPIIDFYDIDVLNSILFIADILDTLCFGTR